LYVFDARSGMFYHASSQFFYDPKTKLYFGNKEQKYYEFCKGEQPPFKEFRPRTVETSKEEVKAEDKKLISISLKTKVLASAGKDSDTKESAPAAGVAVSKSQKAHDANMELWAERGREIRGKEQVVRTKLGQPVCLLCKRKFPDIQKLERHESFSELHKSNLLKYGKKMNVADDMAEAHYRDRALERRVLHGPEFIEQTLSVTAESAGNLGLPAGSLPEENLGDSNVGSQMLQKLGWKKGSNLGKISGEVEAGKLVKDWERIERLARSGKP
jgi:RNA-binding protein 5/10